MRKLILVVALALVVPAAALATEPSHPSHPATPASSHASTTATTALASQPTPTVMWVLRGTLSKYTAATATANGSISITVKSSNFDSTTLKTMTLTFATNSKTNVVLHEGKPIVNNDNGIVKVRAPKGSSATALQTKTAFEVIDQGAST